MKAAALQLAVAATFAAALTSFAALAAGDPPPPPPPPAPPSQAELDPIARQADKAAKDADKAIAQAEKAAARAEKRKHHGLSIRLNGGNINVTNDDDEDAADEAAKDAAKDAQDAKDGKEDDDNDGAGSDPGHESDSAGGGGSTGGDGDVIANLPPDVRDRLTGEQVESILRRQADRHTESMAATLAPAMFFLTVIAIVIAVIMGRHRRERILHETLRAMIEKGVEIPEPLLLNGKKPGSDRRRGLIVGLGGLGLTLCLMATNGLSDGAWAIGLVPVLIGAGYFVAWWLEERRGGGNSSNWRG